VRIGSRSSLWSRVAATLRLIASAVAMLKREIHMMAS
jgi:hypothetical protein